MTKRIHNIPEFVAYMNAGEVDNEDLHIISFEERSDILLKSEPVIIDFYLMAIKPPLEKNMVHVDFLEDQAKSYMYLDCPHNTLEWDIDSPSSGFNIMISPKYLNRYVKDYNFMHYNNHEALFLTKDEEIILWDLYQKAYDEFKKEHYSREVILSYAALILSYTQQFYNRQFDSRSKIYHEVIDNFTKHLNNYYNNGDVPGLPSVAFFAQKANLSANYFGDLIKHFTGESPIEHIHNYIIRLAKQKLKQSSLSVSEISYSLGFDYPTYFTRFFRKQTGLPPKVFRNQ